MSNDRYQEIRDALAMGPTPGPWRADGFEVMAARGQFYGGLILGADDVVVAQMVSAANAPLIAACDPDTIHELLAERDRLAAKQPAAHPAITHCDSCGCDWLDNGLNPVGCPYCKQPASVWAGGCVAYGAHVWCNGHIVATAHGLTLAPYRAARIAACVNACAGIADPAAFVRLAKQAEARAAQGQKESE